MNFCPYCNSDKGIQFRYLSDYTDECYSLNLSDPYIYELKGRMFVSECISCGRLILSDDYGGQLESELFDKAEIIYPSILLSNLSIPEEVRITYENAKRIQRFNPEAFVMSIRKCIEITCKLHGIVKGSLYSKLQQLCSELSIPESLSQAANNIRLIGNKAAHDIEDINPINAQNIDDFFIILMEYIYVLPAKLKWFNHLNTEECGKEGQLITIDGKWVYQKGKYRGWKP